MGCDIHAFIEVRNGDGWKVYDWESDIPEKDYHARWDHPLYIGRNYNLFAMLADVRNGYGFAGCDTGEGFKPIASPRGLPPDVCSVVKLESMGWGIDGHSHSWLTVRELLDYDTSQTSVLSGLVDMEEFRSFIENGSPSGWCGDAWGPKIKKVSNHEMRDLLDRDVDYTPMTRVSWTKTYHDCALKFWDKTVPELQKLGDPDNVRLVFWFDN